MPAFWTEPWNKPSIPLLPRCSRSTTVGSPTFSKPKITPSLLKATPLVGSVYRMAIAAAIPNFIVKVMLNASCVNVIVPHPQIYPDFKNLHFI